MDDDEFAELYGTAADEPASTVKGPAAANGKLADLDDAEQHVPHGPCPAAVLLLSVYGPEPECGMFAGAYGHQYMAPAPQQDDDDELFGQVCRGHGCQLLL